MKSWKIPVSWEVATIIEVQAESLKDAIDKFDKNYKTIDLPNGTYIIDSFKRDDESSINEENGLGWKNTIQIDDVPTWTEENFKGLIVFGNFEYKFWLKYDSDEMNYSISWFDKNVPKELRGLESEIIENYKNR